MSGRDSKKQVTWEIKQVMHVISKRGKQIKCKLQAKSRILGRLTCFLGSDGVNIHKNCINNKYTCIVLFSANKGITFTNVSGVNL